MGESAKVLPGEAAWSPASREDTEEVWPMLQCKVGEDKKGRSIPFYSVIFLSLAVFSSVLHHQHIVVCGFTEGKC